MVFVTEATMRGLLSRAGRGSEVVALQFARNSLGLEFRVGCKLYRVHGSPCRLCGGSGEVLYPKMSGMARDVCGMCQGKGFKNV